ncbi:MAG TPA: ATP-binding protein [Candidatus Limnocylindrales bacterium]|nr:ATP-binding protein [Candidatus Limnocylindrales bacterium]
MERQKSSRWYWFFLPAMAVASFVLHAALTPATAQLKVSAMYSDLLQAALAAIAAGAAWQAGQRGEGFVRKFWRFQASGFALWALAQCLATYYDDILHKSIDQPWPSDLLFFLWMIPVFLSVFLDPRSVSQRIRATKWLDFAQVGILIVSVHLYVFEVPDHWLIKEFSYEKLEFLTTCTRDVVVVACMAWFALRYPDRRVRELYGRMAIVLGIYGLGEGVYLYKQVYERLSVVSVWDTMWTFPMMLATVLIATSSPESVEKRRVEVDGPVAASPLAQITLKLVPLCFPMAVLLMAAHIAEQQLGIAAMAVLSSFACSTMRIAITERQQLKSESALREREALLRSVFEGTGDAIFVKDADGRYLMVNKQIANFFGKPIEAIAGKTAFELTDLETAKELTKSDRTILETGESVTVDFQIPGEAGARHFLMTRAPYRDTNAKVIGVIGISRDITKYRGIEERLRQSQKMEAIGTLAGGVAHDFNNILMVISGYSSVLAESLGTNPKLLSHVEQIRKAGERAASLTRQLLAFSRKQTIQPAPVKLSDVVTGMETLLHRLIGENIAVSTNLAADLGTVMADAGQMEQVILNLSVNARDAMPDGGKLAIQVRNTRVLHGVTQGKTEMKPGDYVELTVSDTGTGMAAAVQAHIFEPFFTTKPVGKGTGLGLSTVYGIVQQAGGYVTFDSAPGAGTTFRVLLPRILGKAKGALGEEEKGPQLRGRETVLLVEDDASVCELVRAVLTSQGYTVLAAQRPQEAERICQAHGHRVDILLTDVIMPGMSGPELAKKLAESNSHLRVLYMSGYIDDSMLRQEIQEQGTAYLQKPFSPLNLAKKVREVLDSLPVQ